LIAELPLVPSVVHSQYWKLQHRVPVSLPRPLTEINQMYQDLQDLKCPSCLNVNTQRSHSWIASDTWRLIDRRTSLRQFVLFSRRPPKRLRTDLFDDLDFTQADQEYKQLGKDIRRLLRRDR
jgi:hypothetical protein